MPEIFEVTVRSGEDICKTISDFVTAHGWQNVMIPAAIGSVIGMEFTAPIGNEFVKMIFVSFLNSNIYLLKKRLTSRVGIFLETPYSKASSHFPIASH